VTAPAAAPAAVSCWGELRAERRLPGVLRVLVDGQHAGAVEYRGSAWVAYWHTARYGLGTSSDRASEHLTAQEAVRAVLRSGWARRLGARAASPVHWTGPAQRAARRATVTAARQGAGR
jgi:hypothetical protein